MKSGFIKTSAVLIASNDRRMVYSSLRDVPEPLRKRLEACTTGKNSGTIVIADRRGKEEMEKAARFSRVAQADAAGGRRVRWNQVWPALVAMTIGAAGAWLAFLRAGERRFEKR